MMSVRMVCFVLMFVIQPYGWYTWVLAAGAIFLPYFAVVVANVGAKPTQVIAQSPDRIVEATHPDAPAPPPMIIRISETPPPRGERDPDAGPTS